MTRQYVHLSYSVATARSVGMRHGVPVVLEINAEQMARDGIVFYRSENGVWLTDSVSPCYISVLSLLCCYQSLHGERINTVPIDHFRPYCCCSWHLSSLRFCCVIVSSSALHVHGDHVSALWGVVCPIFFWRNDIAIILYGRFHGVSMYGDGDVDQR